MQHAGSQANPAIAATRTGYVIAYDNNDPPTDVNGRFYNANGSPATTEYQFNYTALNTQRFAALATLKSGVAIVVYEDFSVDGGGDIRADRYFSNGSIVSSTTQIVAGDFEVQRRPDVTALADGGYVASWTVNYSATDFDIKLRVFNSDTTPRSNVVIVDNSSTLDTNNSIVAGLSGGGFVVAWRQQAIGGGDDSLYFQRYTSSGMALGSRVLVDGSGVYNEDIQVAGLADGGFAVAYSESGNGVDIGFQIFNSDGSARSNNMRLNQTPAGAQNNPSITTLSNGYIMVAWTSDLQYQDFQVFTPQGARVGSESRLFVEAKEGEVAGLGTSGRFATVISSYIVDPAGDVSIQ
ncbi:MAG: hypothetical protein Q7T55_14010, partial [Solirubrobacteraceae bacterium]|nr:hypothetical protein [Solirubrobacteraceae bacterium]